MRRPTITVAVTMAMVGLLLTGCSSGETLGTDGSGTQAPATTGDSTAGETTASPTASPTNAPDETAPSSTTSEASSGVGLGTTDVSGLDWATVDLTTIDWDNVDMTQVSFALIEENPTVSDLSQETVALIQTRWVASWGSGEATLAIGDETWRFGDFRCAFGQSATQSDTYTFSATAFVDVDGGRAQLLVDVTDPNGDGRYSGDGVAHEISFDDVSDSGNPAFMYAVSGDAVGSLTIDGNAVTAQVVLHDAVGGTEAPASFEGECGPASLR